MASRGPLGRLRGVQNAGGVEEVLGLADPDDAEAAEEGVVDLFRAGHRARVGQAGAIAILQYRGV